MMLEPLVFLPGMMCDARLFAPQVNVLSRERAVTVAPITQGERIEEIASGLLDVLPRRFALAGLSMGGIVAMELLRRASDRVTRVALLDTNAQAETAQSAANYEPFIIKLKSAPLPDAVQGFFKPDFLAPGAGRMKVMAQLVEMAENIGSEAIIRQTRALQRRRDYQTELSRCKQPALVLCGAQDGLTPVKRHRFIAEFMPNAELAVIENAGHMSPLEAPEAVLEQLQNWLNRPACKP